MVIHKFWIISGLLITLLSANVFNSTAVQATAHEVPRISIQQAKLMVARPDVIFIDVRTAKSYWRSTSKIPHAVREAPHNVKFWASKYAKDKTLIFYCT